MLIDCVGIAAMACRQKGFPLEAFEPANCHWFAAAGRPAGPVAQWLEPAAHNRLVGGSSPSGPTKISKDLYRAARIAGFPWSTG